MKTMKILFSLFAFLIVAVAASFFAENTSSGAFALAMAVPLVVGSLNIQTSDDARQEKQKLVDQMSGMLETLKSEKRNFTPAEDENYRKLDRQLDYVIGELKRLEAEERSALEAAARAGGFPMMAKPEKWKNPQGQEIRTFGKHESIATATAEKSAPGQIGAILRGLVLGKWDGVSSETRAALATTTSGVEVPAFMLSSLLDRTRAKSLIFNAGAKFVEMQGTTLTIGKVTGDASISVKLENDAFPDNSMTFSPLELKAHTIGAVITLSNELLQDGANMSLAIESALIGALAAKIDQLALFGSGSNEPRGLNATTGVVSVDGAGVISFASLADAWQQISANNARPNAVALSPRDYSKLLTAATPDGLFVGKPKLFDGVNFDFSSVIPVNLGVGENESIAFMGTFEDVIVGIRQGMTFELSGVAGESFQRNQTMIRVLWRGDIAIPKPEQFAKITGLTATGS